VVFRNVVTNASRVCTDVLRKFDQTSVLIKLLPTLSPVVVVVVVECRRCWLTLHYAVTTFERTPSSYCFSKWSSFLNCTGFVMKILTPFAYAFSSSRLLANPVKATTIAGVGGRTVSLEKPRSFSIDRICRVASKPSITGIVRSVSLVRT
jgi:hypothetical protein